MAILPEGCGHVPKLGRGAHFRFGLGTSLQVGDFEGPEVFSGALGCTLMRRLGSESHNKTQGWAPAVLCRGGLSSLYPSCSEQKGWASLGLRSHIYVVAPLPSTAVLCLEHCREICVEWINE